MSRYRKLIFGLLAGAMALAAVLLVSLNAFNFRFLKPAGAGQIFLFTALSVLVFLLLLVLLVLLSRMILKLYAGRRRGLLGSRIRTRLLGGALILAFAPALFMFLFSYALMNRSVDRWFSQPVAQLRNDSTRVAFELRQYAADNARAEAQSIATSTEVNRSLAAGDLASALGAIRHRRITLEGGFALLYRDGQPLLQYQLPASQAHFGVAGSEEGGARRRFAASAEQDTSLPAFLLWASREIDQPIVFIGTQQFVIASAATPGGEVVLAGLPMPPGLSETLSSIRMGARDYWTLFRARNQIRSTFVLLILLLSALTFFASSWLALFLARQVTEPVEALAEAMDKIAAGSYGHRITLGATEEMGHLICSFNAMAADLEESRRRAGASANELSHANRALEDRRRELETVLETIPSGVVTLDAEMRVLQANPAFLELLEALIGFHPEKTGLPPLISLELLFPAELMDDLRRLMRRSQRLGRASGELAFQTPRGDLRLSATAAMLHLGPERPGAILVLEDVTELLQAQRQAAWKEVAQRVAHEIKNPLTPISLSAERIRRHSDRAGADSAGVIRKCSDVILSSVETLRRLVDQFGALAQFPASSLVATDLNAIVAAALLPFTGRLEGIQVERRLAQEIPQVHADPESLKRALINLIDNAAEAMQGSLHRQLTITTGWNEAHSMAEVVVADTGPGITAEMRERLFLPYFSTKRRGSGLGLAIAAQIVQEHGGSIRAERNLPVGARFILEIPYAEGGATEPAGAPQVESAPR